MALVNISVTIEGTTPLLVKKFTDDAAMSASSGNRSSYTGDLGTPREQAESRLYHAADGVTLVVPQPNVLRCLIDAGTFFKAGKSKISTQKSSLIPACVRLPGVAFPIIHREPWTVDSRPVTIPSTGGRVMSHRPKFEDWKLEFEMELDTSMISVKLLREIVDAAGRRIGLGEFRPARKGPFGQFAVTRWEVEELSKVA